MIDYDEISYSEITDCIIDAQKGRLSPYWQGYAEREFDSLRNVNGQLPRMAQLLYAELKEILSTVPQCGDDEPEGQR